MNIFEEIRVSEIDGVALIDNTEGYGRRINNRFAYALSFCLSGQITYHHRGKTYVSDVGSVVFLPKGESYTISCEKSGVFPIINFYCCKEPTNNSFFRAQLNNPEYFIAAFEKLSHAFAFPKSSRNVHALAIFYDILSHIVNDVDFSCNELLAPAIKYLEENFCDPALNNHTLAEQCHISEVYFRRLFAETYGTSPHKYISDLRIQRAKELLKNNRISISQVSENCGYTSVYHFCRAFKAAVGESAGKFRQSHAFWF